ncbi:HEAT repeat domain-containing protein [Roseiflexus castenholzii]|uniref:PBS lyase HEAT domain protein repeat-containing protein n=1 Tax=Roseiflexus castenholzii (strain DSM 13941 / HLO8) TaxID=383372 RepID=A7NFA4_ROSCS|nr:HEAT repeat domain-containing protein [Roseiflexus castenholzii]ABU58370.1 PBS lyase HEAT domain protein repeat-containing protein [Roseiflexus castenholzii DSM 13941]
MVAINPLRWLKRRRTPPVAPAPAHEDTLAVMVRDIVRTNRLALLDDLSAADRTTVAVRLAVRADDPRALIRFLWRRAAVTPEYLLTLVACLKAIDDASAFWVIRTTTALAEGRAGDRTASSVLQALLDCLPMLDAALDQIVQRQRSPLRLLRRLFEALTPELALPRLMRLAFDEATPTALAWAAADRLAECLSGTATILDPPTTPAAHARWLYVDALMGAAGIQTQDAAALPSFAATTAGAARCERLGCALLANTNLSPAIRLAAVDLLLQQATPPWTVIVGACADEQETVRRGALARIGSSSAREAMAMLVRLALRSDMPIDVRLMAVIRLSAETQWDVAPVLQRCARDASLPLAGRLRAAAALGRRSANLPRLLALMRDPQAHLEVRAAAARAAAFPSAAPYLVRLALDPATPAPVVTALWNALATPACRATLPGMRSALVRLLDAARADVALTLALIRVAGAVGGDEAIAALTSLAGSGAITRLRSAVPPDLLDLPVEACLEYPLLPPPMRTRLLTALATAPTPAEQPTTLAQFLAREADLVRCAAIEALTLSNNARARAAILIALRHAPSPGVATALAEALDLLGSLQDMLQVVVDPELDATLRWHVADRLAQRVDGPTLIREAWVRSDLDAFGRELIIDALVRHDAKASAPFFMRLANDPGESLIFRERALMALDGVTDASLEDPLVRLVNDVDLDPGLRGRAAASLPAPLSPAICSTLRDLARTDAPAPLLIGVLQALGRARDAAALPILVRYSLDHRAAIAQTAVEALAANGDNSISPLLVRVALSPQANAAVKLVALESLVRLGEPDAGRLLRPYLRNYPIIFQMRAFRLLANAGQVSNEAERLVRDRLCPTPLRLCALEYLPCSASAGALLAALLRDAGENPVVRAAAAARLPARDYGAALTEAALDTTTPIIVRTACLAGLGASGDADALLALSALAERDCDPVARERARLELWSLAMQSLSDRAPDEYHERHYYGRR